VVHHDQWGSSFGRASDRLVHAYPDRGSITDCHIVHRLSNFIWNRSRDGVEMAEFGQVLGTCGTDGEEVGAGDVAGAGFKGLGRVRDGY
jgi:hypothetical protein